MTEDLDRDDRAVLTALARVTGGAEPSPPAAAADENLVREYLETLGLLPYGLEPQAPSPAVKERILARIGDRPAAGPSRRGFDEVTFAGIAADPVDVTLQGRGEPEAPPSAAATIPFPQGQPAVSAAPPRPNRWTAALAAALVLCVAGLAYLTGKVHEQNRTIARLSEELHQLPVADLASLHAELEAMERHFHMVTAVARQAYHLQGVERVGDRPVDGVVYVCGDHQRWYLNVQGLETPPPGQEYRLWFLTGEGMVDGGVVKVEEGAKAEMEAPTMPEGTRGFAVTLEEAGNAGDSPDGIMVLLGEESVSL